MQNLEKRKIHSHVNLVRNFCEIHVSTIEKSLRFYEVRVKFWIFHTLKRWLKTVSSKSILSKLTDLIYKKQNICAFSQASGGILQ